MDIQTRGFLSIGQVANQYLTPNENNISPSNKESVVSFKEIFENKSAEVSRAELKFSKHAAGRLQDRNISLTSSQLERLNDGARKAEEKGIKDSLVIVDDLAFIVNVPNSTVITAMDSTETNDNVFTNINGAVIM